MEAVLAALADGASPNGRASQLGLTPLHLAAAGGHAAAVAELLNTPGIDVMAADEDEEQLTPVHAAAKCGHVEVVGLFLDDTRAGVGVNLATPSGRVTLLHAAASGGAGVGATACVRLLLERGATVNALDATGLTPLAEAARGANIAVVRVLLAAGADANARVLPDSGSGAGGGDGAEPVGVTPLHLAVFNADTRDAAAVVEALCRAGAATALADDMGVTPLHAAVARPRLAGLPADVPPDVATQVGEYREALTGFLVGILLRHGAPVNARDVTGATPLHFAARNGWGEAVFALLEGGADAALRDEAGALPADAAAEANEPQLAKVLAAAARGSAGGAPPPK